MRLWSLGASLVLVLVSRAAAESKQLSCEYQLYSPSGG